RAGGNPGRAGGAATRGRVPSIAAARDPRPAPRLRVAGPGPGVSGGHQPGPACAGPFVARALLHPRRHHAARAARAAREWGVPPRVILRGGEPAWTFTDRVLAAASVIADDMRCPGCGHPKHEAWNPDSEGWYVAREADCQGCAALQRAADGEREPRPE